MELLTPFFQGSCTTRYSWKWQKPGPSFRPNFLHFSKIRRGAQCASPSRNRVKNVNMSLFYLSFVRFAKPRFLTSANRGFKMPSLLSHSSYTLIFLWTKLYVNIEAHNFRNLKIINPPSTFIHVWRIVQGGPAGNMQIVSGIVIFEVWTWTLPPSETKSPPSHFLNPISTRGGGTGFWAISSCATSLKKLSQLHAYNIFYIIFVDGCQRK